MKPVLAKHERLAFILDAGHDIEQKLLERALTELCDQQGFDGRVDTFIVSISRNPENVDTTNLLPLTELDSDTWVIPLRVVWLPPKKIKNRLMPVLRSRLAGGNLPNRTKASQIVERSPHRTLVAFGEGASLGELRQRATEAAAGDDRGLDLAGFIAGQATLTLDIAAREITGGRYKVPRLVAENIKASPLFKQTLKSISKESKRSVKDILTEVDEIMDEMVAKPQPFWLDVSNLIAKKITSLAYESDIVVNHDELAKVKDVVSSYPSALLWTHKTYVDGMALQKVMFENDMPSAHTFGGLNMAFGALGYTSRRSGIIFIRRTFQDNLLYKTILRHYIGFLLEKKFPFSWAFEGTRSRVGKLMPPRFGLLKYLVEAAHTTGTKNVHIIPVAINYDMIGDVADYAREQLGESKSAESMKWFVGYLRGLRKPMGRIYMDFGAPVVLATAPDPEDALAVSKIAFQVAVEANRVTQITLVSLASMVLLSAAPRALTRAELAAGIQQLVGWARDRKIPVTSDFNAKSTEHAESIFEVLVENKLLTQYDDGAMKLFTVGPNQHAEASYYRNTTVHHFIVKAFAEVALLASSKYHSENDRTTTDIFWEQIHWLRDVFKFEFFYPSSEEFDQDVRSELDRYNAGWEGKLSASADYGDDLLKAAKPLVAHATLLQFAEAYWIAASVSVQMNEGEPLDRSAFVNSALKYGRRAFLQHRIGSKSSISKQLFENAFKLLQNNGLIDSPDVKEIKTARVDFQNQMRSLIHRLERIRARSLPQ